MGLNDRLKQAAGYKASDFYKADSIGIICRGPSVYRLDLCYRKFQHCYLSGEFNHTLHRIERYLDGKDIVLCTMQQFRYRTSEENCKKFNIRNMQVRFQEGTKSHRECIERFPDLKVVGYNKKHYEMIANINKSGTGIDRSIFTTGMAGIISALYFNPKDLYIIGLDFYNRAVKPYFVREDMDIPHSEQISGSVKGFRQEMLEGIGRICDLFPETNLYLYTTYRGIRSKKNLHVMSV